MQDLNFGQPLDKSVYVCVTANVLLAVEMLLQLTTATEMYRYVRDRD